MPNIFCDVCSKKKIIWVIFECNIDNKEECPCKTCVVLATCTRLCNRFNKLETDPAYGNCALRRCQ
jgi:hypothetical protein